MEMTKTTVHKVHLYDAKNDETIISRRYATPEGAERMGGAIIEGTAVVIDFTELEPGFEWTAPERSEHSDDADRGQADIAD
jgi:hypothetical protein